MARLRNKKMACPAPFLLNWDISPVNAKTPMKRYVIFPASQGLTSRRSQQPVPVSLVRNETQLGRTNKTIDGILTGSRYCSGEKGTEVFLKL